MSRELIPGAPVLVIDTAMVTAVVGLGGLGGVRMEERTWRAGHRHGEELLARIDELLAAGSTPPEALAAIVVGTGPGTFTGLRVGLATAKGLAHGLGVPLVGISTGEALVAAATASGVAGPVALLLPAGPSDRVLLVDGVLTLLPHGLEPDLLPGSTLVAVDLDGRAPADAADRGRLAMEGLGRALMALGSARLLAGDFDDVAQVVPEYVTLPRGVTATSGEVAWSRGPR